MPQTFSFSKNVYAFTYERHSLRTLQTWIVYKLALSIGLIHIVAKAFAFILYRSAKSTFGVREEVSSLVNLTRSRNICKSYYDVIAHYQEITVWYARTVYDVI